MTIRDNDYAEGIPLESPIVGVDVVTGQPATTGGPYASGHPVKPFNHPAAIKAQQVNKTGDYAAGGPKEDKKHEKQTPATLSLDEIKGAEKKKSDEFAAKLAAERKKAESEKPPEAVLTPSSQPAPPYPKPETKDKPPVTNTK